MDKKLDCTLKQGISEKTGKPYYYLSIILTSSGLEKRVFLQQAEVECVKLSK